VSWKSQMALLATYLPWRSACARHMPWYCTVKHNCGVWQCYQYSRTPFIWKKVIRIVDYWLGPSVEFVENSTKLTFLEITGYRIKFSTLLWLLELQIRGGRKV